MRHFKFDKIEFIKSWLVFLFCISIQTCYYRYDVDREITIHFLWWHARFFYMKPEK